MKKTKYLSIKTDGVPGEAQSIRVFACDQNPYEIDKTKKTGKPVQTEEQAAADRERCNINRAKAAIKEIVMNNYFPWFVTLTISPEKFDRKDYATIEKKLRQFLNDFKKRYADEFKYLLIPEMHADGSWHFHGFMDGIPMEYLEKFVEGMQMSSYLARKVKQGKEIYNFPAYAKRFGFCDLELIEDKARCASYVTKYITKNLGDTASAMRSGANLYYCSQGLKRSKRSVAEEVSVDAVEALKSTARDGRVFCTDFGEGWDIAVPEGCEAEEYLCMLLDSLGIEVKINKTLTMEELLADAPW